MTVLLKKMLASPVTSSKLVVFDPFGEFDREALVKEVVGLANAQVDGPRNILFGVNPGAIDGDGIVGIPESTAAELKKAHRLISALVEPFVNLAFIFDNINGKLVGALEIDDCGFGPYFVGQDLSDELRRGSCWIREDRNLLAVERNELLNGHAPEVEHLPAVSPEDVSISVGFNDDPDCKVLEVTVPDTSAPPFAEEDGLSKTSRLTQAIKDKVNTMTTRIMRMRQAAQEPGTAGEAAADEADRLVAAAKEHYYYEERAVHVNFCIVSTGDTEVRDLSVELGFPRMVGLDVADRLYASPFDKRMEIEHRKLGYPKVTHRDDAIIVHGTVAVLEPEKPRQLLPCALRLAVAPAARGKKFAIVCVLRGPDGQRLGSDRLKIEFDRKPAAA